MKEIMLRVERVALLCFSTLWMGELRIIANARHWTLLNRNDTVPRITDLAALGHHTLVRIYVS